MKVIRIIVTILGAALMGAVLTELFLRALIPVEAQYETWFTPGIEKWDDEFGAIYRANWKGWMRHMDGLYRGVPLELDEHGYRLPVRNTVPGPPRRILMMGGRSAMMSYGLNENETVHARMVQSMDLPVEAQSIPSAGGNLLRDWIQYRRNLMEEEFDLVVISHVNPYLPAYRDPEAFDQLPEPPPREWVFHYMDGIVLWRDGLFLKTGRAAFQSYLGYGLVRIADAVMKMRPGEAEAKPQGLSQVVARQARAPDPQDLAHYKAFLIHLKNHFEDRGIPVVIHLIPRPFAGADHHAPYRTALSPELDVIDLQLKLHEQLSGNEFIANGHYGPTLAEIIGQALAEEVSTRLSSANP